MRRFSQRSHLVTLSEINITPLLDLAFVLLIIFIITTQGVYTLNRKRMTLAQVGSQLDRDFKANPALVIYVRADENSRMKDFVALTDTCTRNGISRYSIRTDPSTTR